MEDAETFARLAMQLHEQPNLDETIERILEFALRAVDGDHAGVLLVHGGRRIETGAATSPLIEQVDRFQIETGDGPSLAVMWEKLSVVIDDTARDDRWSKWSSHAATLGLRNVLCVRLITNSTAIGALNLYGREPGRFDDDDEAVAHILARHASITLASAKQETTLWRAIDARKLIGQAQGILMERFDLDADQAFAILRRYSQDNNVKLREVARRLVETRKLR